MKADPLTLVARLADARFKPLGTIVDMAEEAAVEIVRLRRALSEIAIIAHESHAYATPGYNIERVAHAALATDPYSFEEEE